MTQSYVETRMTETGDLILEGQDIGTASLSVFGENEYEYAVTVPAAQKDLLLLRLVRERFLTDPTPSSTFMAYLKAANIPYQFQSS
jgi:hypothetical protein